MDLSTITSEQAKKNNTQKCESSVKLSDQKIRCDNQISRIRHDIKHPFRRILTFYQERQNSCVMTFFPRLCPRRWRTHHTQWWNFYPLHYPEICGIVSYRRRVRCTIHECERRTQYSTGINRTRSFTTTEPHSLWQCYRSRHYQWHHKKTTLPLHGNAIFKSQTIWFDMSPGSIKFRWL